MDRTMATIFTKQSGIRAVSVGADAHIGPLGSYEFAEDFRKKRYILRADRVVRPYEGCAYRNFTICTSSRYVPSLRQNAFGMQPISVKPSFR